MDTINNMYNNNNKPKEEKVITKKYKIKDVFDKKTYPKQKANKIISVVTIRKRI
jgi:hypothetical protein